MSFCYITLYNRYIYYITRYLCYITRYLCYITFRYITWQISSLTVKQAKFAFTYDIFSNYKPFFSSAPDKYLHSGVGLLLHNSFAIYVQKTGSLPGRVLYVDLYIKGKTKLRIDRHT